MMMIKYDMFGRARARRALIMIYGTAGSTTTQQQQLGGEDPNLKKQTP
jgi:hypothetical protein